MRRQSLFQVCVTAFAGSLLFIAIIVYLNVARSRYVETQARVLTAQTEVRRAGRSNHVAGVSVGLEYMSNGQARNGSAWLECEDMAHAKARLADYGVGSVVVVYVHPKEPTTVVLSTDMTPMERTALPVLVVVAAAAGVGLFLVPRE